MRQEIKYENRILEFKASDVIPDGAKFLHTKQVVVGYIGSVGSIRDIYNTVYVYEVRVPVKPKVKRKKLRG